MKTILILTQVFVAHLLMGQNSDWKPETVPGNQVMDYPEFSLSYNDRHEQPDWVAYELTAEEVAAYGDRCDGCFVADERTDSESASPSDYSSTGFDKGHLAPSADKLKC